MEDKTVLLRRQLAVCQNLLRIGYDNLMATNLCWLNDFCAECLEFATLFQKYIAHDLDNCKVEGIGPLECAFLCLTQIVCCIKHFERSIKVEEERGATIPASRQHFLGRINFCLGRLDTGLRLLATVDVFETERSIEEQNFVELVDLTLEDLTEFSDYNKFGDDIQNSRNTSLIIREENNCETQSKKIRSIIDLILAHTLALANVTLQQDKKALSALCQKVLRECTDFQKEFNQEQTDFQKNDSNRKLSAMSLNHALCRLEDLINEALLRLVFTCFLDFKRCSIQKLRLAIDNAAGADDTVVDELIADFDVNIDRSMQIGIFAIAFAPNIKMKTIIRSCLASFEALDTCLVPSLQTRIGNSHSEILERHFNEEVINFKNALQEITDSHAFVSCYVDMLSDCIAAVEKNYQLPLLDETIQMGDFLYEHFQYADNLKTLDDIKYPARREHFDKFCIMLRECQAILPCAEQVDSKRILKRFKILRNILRKLRDSLSDDGNASEKGSATYDLQTSDEISYGEFLFESEGICPSICSILYANEKSRRRNLIASVSLTRSHSKLSDNPASFASPGTAHSKANYGHLNVVSNALAYQSVHQPSSLRRRESLRTAMFKRLNVPGSKNMYKAFKLQSAHSQMDAILHDLANLSCSFSSSAGSDDVLAPIPHS